MREYKNWFWLCVFVLFFEKNEAQSGFFMPPNEHQVEIPFELENNFIILKVLFNNTFPLRFIFDTGAEHTILTKREIPDALHVLYEREFKVLGADMKTELIAYLARGMRLEIEDKIAAPYESVLVLDDDYFRFEEFTGVNVHGILGANTFSRYLIRINYQRQVITLIDREFFKPPPDFMAVPIEVYRNKPYLILPIQLQNDSVINVKLLLDTGAALNLMLFTNTHPSLSLPPTVIKGNIGMGLGGFLEGFLGRSKKLQIGNIDLPNVLTYFQSIDTVATSNAQLHGRNGILGNKLLSRFQVIFDLSGEVLYLKSTRKFEKSFDFDRSGLSLVASGAELNRFTIQEILPNSPASEAGLQKGDRLLRIGWLPASWMSLADIQRKLEGKGGRTIRLKFKRDGHRFSKKITLRDLI